MMEPPVKDCKNFADTEKKVISALKTYLMVKNNGQAYEG